MIDCSKTKNYFAEKQRMTKKHKLNDGAYICELNCTYCPLSSLNNNTSNKISCFDLETFYPQRAIEIIQRWSDEHPQKTYLTDFLDKHPNAPLTNGIPSGLCPYYLGYMTKKEFDECFTDCQGCWNTPIVEREKENE